MQNFREHARQVVVINSWWAASRYSFPIDKIPPLTLFDEVVLRHAGLRLPEVEFVRRFLLHVLPKGVKRIRNYGLLAAGCNAVKLMQTPAAQGAQVKASSCRGPPHD